jgi:DNA-binding NarL/FixJ family response regulator
LRSFATTAAALPLDRLGFHVEFFDPRRLDELEDDGSPVFLPACSEAQAAIVRALREQFGYWLSPIVAVVNDCHGHQTYTAIKCGATCVLNVAIPAEAQVKLLQSMALPGPVIDEQPRSTALRPVPDAAQQRQLADGEAETLTHLLCSDETVCTIARRFFCSERTMYRKIRTLYDALNVSGRSELRSLVALQARAG